MSETVTAVDIKPEAYVLELFFGSKVWSQICDSQEDLYIRFADGPEKISESIAAYYRERFGNEIESLKPSDLPIIKKIDDLEREISEETKLQRRLYMQVVGDDSMGFDAVLDLFIRYSKFHKEVSSLGQNISNKAYSYVMDKIRNNGRKNTKKYHFLELFEWEVKYIRSWYAGDELVRKSMGTEKLDKYESVLKEFVMQNIGSFVFKQKTR